MTFEVIPSIDLKGGRCVRLYQGDYQKETVFSDDPLAMARKWASLGAPRLHVVDLDGAAAGELQHLALIKKITSQIRIPVQVGGGVRNIQAIRDLLEAGVKRVILGTAAVEEPDLVGQACRLYADSIIVGIDARAGQAEGGRTSSISGYVAVHGWLNDTPKLALDLVGEMTGLGARRFIYTDIMRDGTLTRPNFDAIAELISQTGATVIASGGITGLKHLEKLNEIGAEGAIIGRALYTGDIDLEKALGAFRKDNKRC